MEVEDGAVAGAFERLGGGCVWRWRQTMDLGGRFENLRCPLLRREGELSRSRRKPTLCRGGYALEICARASEQRAKRNDDVE